MSDPVKTEVDESKDERSPSPSFEGLLDPDQADGGEKQQPRSVSNQSRNKIMAVAALVVVLIIGVSVVVWHFTKEEGNHVSIFESSKINHGGITTDARGNEITHGCSGKLIATPQFERGDIEKVDTDGYDQQWRILANFKKDNVRTTYITIEGTCCWEITDRHGNSETIKSGWEGVPGISHLKIIKTKKC